MAAADGRDTLPENWTYGVCRDGRVFFINDQTCSTSWLHPRTGEPVNSGHMIRSDLPRGWEEGFTEEGANYFINHNQRTTTFRHPVTGQISPENTEFILHEQPNSHMSKQQTNQRPSSMVSETSTAVTTSTVDTASGSKASKSSNKLHTFGKRDQAIKRDPNVPVVVRGWLYKQDSSGMRLWKRRWFVLADYCLFYYKDSREETVLGSIPLPSYVISPVEPEDRINRKYAFKAEHSGMRTYYFSADTQEDMNGWIRAMNQTALMQTHTLKRQPEKMEKQTIAQGNHIDSSKGYTKAEVVPSKENSRKAEDETFGFEKREEIRKEREDEERYGFRKDTVEELGRKRDKVPAALTESDSLFTEPPGFSSSQPAQPQIDQRNGTLGTAVNVSTEQNGTGVYRRGFVPRTETEKQAQRKSNLAQVEHWVKLHKGDSKSVGPEQTLPHRTSSQTQPYADNYQTLPKSVKQPSGSSPPLPSDYKYAHDRISHLRMSNEERKASKEGTVWQLYEWQQRQQFKHGSPTAPIYSGSSDYTDNAVTKASLEIPRSISIPPSPSDIPPPGPPKLLSPRRPHTPAERVSVKPTDERPTVDISLIGSPKRMRSYATKTGAHIDRRSMPPMGYITHTISAPSLHGKSPEELTLLLIRLRRHQAKLASLRNYTLAQLQQHEPTITTYQADDTYIQLKKDLEYLDLKIKTNEPLINMVHKMLKSSAQGLWSSKNVSGRETLKDRTAKPVVIAESDVDVKLSRLCEQDRILQELEDKIRHLKENKDKLETVLEGSRRQMEHYKDQPQHTEKIAYQQRLLQEDLVQIRAEISKVSTEMENAWNEYGKMENDVNQLREALQHQMNRASISLEKTQMQKDLWRIEDVIAGLSASKINYKVIIESIQNPERKTVPSVSSTVPSVSVSLQAWEGKPVTQRSSQFSPLQPSMEIRPLSHPQPYTQPRPLPLPQPRGKIFQPQPNFKIQPKVEEDDAPPRPPLPHIYSPDGQPPVVPPLPKESAVIRHMSVRGLKRQSDERKRDRELGHYMNGDYRLELRSYMSEPELLTVGSAHSQTPVGISSSDSGYQTLPGRGLSGSTSKLHQSSTVASYVTLRRGATTMDSKERPKSALERLYSGEHQRGRMSAEEQLQRMKLHQKALVRERKRTLSQGERQSISSRTSARPISADVGSWKREQEFDLQLLEKAVRGEEAEKEQQDEWLKVQAVPLKEPDMEPDDYDLDISKELSKPEKVLIPERYIELEPEEPLSIEEVEARNRKVERIKSILARSSVQNVQSISSHEKHNSADFDSHLQEQERIITISHALASEASQRSKQVAAKAVTEH
ncbi:pleckstrin homology domain-containing family A member 7 isoform X4 [Latimeria chalumnae]|uniref:pleckstrin homology domain-containing family A member 7 isoform X4 n=1 Tax=Latimeria chalumnae TaxID=7897 RepID=UPI00313DC20B